MARRNPPLDPDYVRIAAKGVKSWPALCRLVGRSTGGPVIAGLRKFTAAHGIDTTHFIERKPINVERFVGTDTPWGNSRHYIKKILFETGTLKEECMKCGQGNTYHGEPLPLVVDRADNDKTNNALENLRVLCPNCYAQIQAKRMVTIPKRNKAGGRAKQARREATIKTLSDDMK